MLIVFFSFSHLDVNGGVKGFSTSGYFCPQVCQVSEISEQQRQPQIGYNLDS